MDWSLGGGGADIDQSYWEPIHHHTDGTGFNTSLENTIVCLDWDLYICVSACLWNDFWLVQCFCVWICLWVVDGLECLHSSVFCVQCPWVCLCVSVCMCLYLSVWDSVCFCVEVNKVSVMVVNKMVDMVVDEVADMYQMINVCIIPTYFNIRHVIILNKATNLTRALARWPTGWWQQGRRLRLSKERVKHGSGSCQKGDLLLPEM